MNWTREDKLILASASPRRADLLDLAGIPFRRMGSGVSEDVDAPVNPEDHVVELSRRKARDVAENRVHNSCMLRRIAPAAAD